VLLLVVVVEPFLVLLRHLDYFFKFYTVVVLQSDTRKQRQIGDKARRRGILQKGKQPQVNTK